VRGDLPTGLVTFLFTDVEGSTGLLRELGAEGYAGALAEHRRVVREVCAGEGGVEVDTQGDAFFFAFASAPGAVAAAQGITDALAQGPIHLRIGLHSGTPLLTDEGYVGDDVHLAARIAASGHGGQVVLSNTTREHLDGLVLTDLGEHRLKDIEGAVSIYQLGETGFPPLKSISNTNLPRPASSFVGRERELSEVLAAFERGARLLTLTGPGGSGKTRLAVEAAATLVPSYRAGVFWVGLAALRESWLVTETIAQTLGAKDGLAAHIGEREMLLLLDNLEQVIEAAPDLSTLLSSCPNLTLLCTSRELLRVQGEVEYPVPPLASWEAVELFCERSGLEPSGEITELCARLDDLPLAVELAAARTRALSPGQILERCSDRLDLLRGGRDADVRQQTLRATISWSYELLSEEEQRVFGSLSVFAGGCTLEAAEEVADADLDTLQSLVEKSLLRFTDERYWMLETIREYAAARLGELDATGATHRALAEHLLALEGLENEVDNLRAAVNWAIACSETELVLRLATAATWIPAAPGPLEQGRWLDEALRDADSISTLVRAQAVDSAAAAAFELGDFDKAQVLGEQSRSLYLEAGDAVASVRALSGLGVIASGRGEWTRARAYFNECIDLATRLPDSVGLYRALHGLGELERELGNLDRASELLERSADLVRDGDDSAPGDATRLAAVTHGLGDIALAKRELAQANQRYWEALQLAREINGWYVASACLGGLAAVAAIAGNAERAGRLWGGIEPVERETGWRLRTKERMQYEEIVEACRAVDPTSLAAAVEQGQKMTAEVAIEYALNLASWQATTLTTARPRAPRSGPRPIASDDNLELLYPE
jgi:predicted ATPase